MNDDERSREIRRRVGKGGLFRVDIVNYMGHTVHLVLIVEGCSYSPYERSFLRCADRFVPFDAIQKIELYRDDNGPERDRQAA